ncbi:MAG: C-GCAxxG-C-C family protein [archaeon]|nr:C-GCAxxG-C-C family protein [archaeon]
MEFDRDLVCDNIRELRKEKSCSQSTLVALLVGSDCKLSQEELFVLASGFSGGIGGTFDEGTCGAVTGAIMAMGFLSDDNVAPLARSLFNDFKEEYTSVRCDIISKNGEDKSPCAECCVFAAEKVMDLLGE